MKNKKNLSFYLITLGLFLFFKFLYRSLNVEDLLLFLKPVNKLTSLFIGIDSTYISGKGYYFETLNILIEKSCSGYGVWTICFLMLSFLALNYIKKNSFKVASILLSMVIAYFFAIFINSFRIVISILIQKLDISFINERHFVFHESIGILTNLTFLILIYLLTKRLLTIKKKHVQST